MQGPATTSRRSEGPRAASLPDQRSSAWLSRGASAGVDLELPTPLLEEKVVGASLASNFSQDCGRIDPGGKPAPYRTALIEGGGISTHEGRNDAFHAHAPSLCPRRGPSCWIYLPLPSPRAPPVFE